MKSAVQPSREDVREELNAICAHERFARSSRLRQFLRFIVEQRLLGRDVNEQIIGVNVFERKGGYDSGNDTIVRTEAVALRRRLEDYYKSNSNARVKISVLRGGYNPTFTWIYQEPGRAEGSDPLTFPDIPEPIQSYENWRESAPEAAGQGTAAVSKPVACPERRRFAPNWRIAVAASLVVAASVVGFFF